MIQKVFQKLAGPGALAQLARGAGSTFLIRALGVVALFGANVLIARLAGQEAYGIYATASNFLILLTAGVLLGFDVALLRFVSEYQSTSQWGLLAGLLRHSTRLVLGAAFLVSLIGAAVVWFLRDQWQVELFHALLIALVIGLPIRAWGELVRVQLQGFRRMVLSNFPGFLLHPLLLVGGIALVGWWQPAWLNGATSILIYVLTAALTLLVGLVFLRSAHPPAIRQATPILNRKVWIGVALPLLLILASNVINTRMDILMVSLLRGATQAGIYAAAVQASRFVIFGIIAMNGMAAPLISSLYAQGRKDELQRMVYFAAVGVTLFTLPVGGLMALFSQPILNIFGQGFSAAHVALMILILGQAVNAMCGPTGLLLAMTGHERVAAAIVVFSAGVNILLNALLIPRFGINGAAIATTVANVLWNGIMLVFLKKRMNINPTIFTWRRRPEK